MQIKLDGLLDKIEDFWGKKYRVVKSPGINVVDQKLSSDSDNSTQINSTASPKDEISTSPEITNHNQILSPMPGTFYSAPSPEAESFVKAADGRVKSALYLAVLETLTFDKYPCIGS